MSNKSVFCIATSRNQTDKIVSRLKIANFSNRDISVLFADKNTRQDFAQEKMKEENILISVHTDNSDEIELVKKIFSDADGEDICTSSESSKGDPYEKKQGRDCAKTGTICISGDHKTRDLTTSTGMPVRGSYI